MRLVDLTNKQLVEKVRDLYPDSRIERAFDLPENCIIAVNRNENSDPCIIALLRCIVFFPDLVQIAESGFTKGVDSFVTLDTYTYENAPYEVECIQVYNSTRKMYTMPCHILQDMGDERVKILVFGNRFKSGTEKQSRIRYVSKLKVRERSATMTQDVPENSVEKSNWTVALLRCTRCNSIKKLSIENCSESRVTFCRVCGEPTLMKKVPDCPPELTNMPHFDFKVYPDKEAKEDTERENEELENKSEELKSKIRSLVEDKIQKTNSFFKDTGLLCTQTHLKIEEASEIFKQYGLDDNISCVIAFNYSGWSFWFYYKGIACSTQNYTMDKVYLLQLLSDCVKQNTSTPNFPKEEKLEKSNPNNRVFGMLPMNKITIHKQYKTENGVILINAGSCGWTITYQDYSSVWKDVEDTDENNFNAALLIAKSEYTELVEIPKIDSKVEK